MPHLKRFKAPKFWRVPVKKRTWVVKPRAGPHKKFECIPLLVLVRNILNLADTGKDARKIIKAKEILIDGKPKRDPKYPVGLFDVVEIPKLKKCYRVVPVSDGLSLIEIPKKEAKNKIYRINNKTVIRGGLLQLNLHDGKNIIVKKDVYKTGDSVFMDLTSQKILKHIKLEKGSLGIIIGGQNKGEVAKVKEVIETRSREPNKVLCEKKGKGFEAIKDYVFVVGKKKPVIKVKA